MAVFKSEFLYLSVFLSLPVSYSHSLDRWLSGIIENYNNFFNVVRLLHPGLELVDLY